MNRRKKKMELKKYNIVSQKEKPAQDDIFMYFNNLNDSWSVAIKF